VSKRFWYVAAVVLALALGWIGFRILTRPVHQTPQEIPTLRVGSHTTILSAALDVTAAKGYFQREGLHVVLDHQESSKITMPALLSGTLVIAIGSNSAGSLNHLATGKIQILADAARVVPRLLVRKDLLQSGRVSTISDLRDRSIRVPREGSASHFALHKILAAHGVPDEEVQLAFLDEQITLAELKRGDLDAGILNEPYASEAIQQGTASEPWVSQIAQIFGERGQEHMVLFINKAYGDSHPGLVGRFLDAYRDGIRDYLKAREAPSAHTEILQIIARYTGATTEVVTKAEWPWISPNAHPDLEGLRESQTYFLAKDLIEKPVELRIWSPPLR
jgi:NitT/TauT family transport system substrate-binding protein